MKDRRAYEQECENAVWRSSIKKMFKSGDLEGLIELKEGPEILDVEVIELLDYCINKLDSKEIGEGQAEK